MEPLDSDPATRPEVQVASPTETASGPAPKADCAADAASDSDAGGNRISRRAFLAVGATGALAATGIGVVWWKSSDSGARAAPSGAPGAASPGASGSAGASGTSASSAGKGPVLVLLTLYGGNDGLNTVVPYEDPSYESARGSMALDPSTVLPLKDGFGLHPVMTGFHELFDQNKLAIVQGVGYPDPNLSHFASMDIWQSANPDGDESSGWIGRWLDATGTDPLRAASIGPTLPLALMGAKVQGAAVPPPPLTLPGTKAQQSAFADMDARGAELSGLLADVASSGSNLLVVQRTLAPVLDTAGATTNGSAGGTAGGATGAAGGATSLEGAGEGALAITQGGGGTSASSVLSGQLDLVTRMIDAGVPTKVYAVSFGGFDTHTNEASTQKTLLTQLDQAVSAFLSGVADAPHGRPVVVLIHTEFGRRVAGNASGGTDHGTANVVFVAGSTVKGGLYGDPPSLTKLDDNGNLVFTTDFRSVYATIFGQVIGVDPKSFLGSQFPTLPILA